MAERLANFDNRVRAIGEQLSTLAGWWSTRQGSDLAEQRQEAIYQIRHWDVSAVKKLRNNNGLRYAGMKRWRPEWRRSLANQLRAEIRGEAPPAQGKLLLSAHLDSWRGPAPTGLP